MWVMAPIGFFSVVAARNKQAGAVDPATVMVRARDRKHLEALKAQFAEQLSGAEIVETPHSDYPCRLVVPKAAWVNVAAGLAESVGYDNFKNEAERVNGHDAYVDALHSVWGVMRRFQLSLSPRRGGLDDLPWEE